MSVSMSKNLVIRFMSDTRQAVRGIEDIKKRLDHLEMRSGKTMDKMERGFNRTGRSARKFGDEIRKSGHRLRDFTGFSRDANKTMGGMSTMFGGIAYRLIGFKRVLEGLPGSLKAIAAGAAVVGVSFNRLMHHGLKAESAIITMTTLLNSQEKALELYEHALRFAGRTPFDPAEVGAASGRAVQYGLQQPFEKAFKGIGKAYSAMDIFSALGSFTDSQNRMIGVSRAMQAIMTGNLKMARAFRGVIGTAWDDTKKVARVGTKLWGQELLKRIAKIPRVLELAEKRADSITGAWSTIKGYAAEFWVMMSGVSRPGMHTFWKEIQSIVLSIRDGIRVFLDDSRAFFEVVGYAIGSAFGFIFDTLKSIWKVIGPIVRIVWQLATGALAIIVKGVIIIFKILFKIGKAVVEVLGHLFGWGDAVKRWGHYTEKLIIWIKDALSYLEIFYLFLSKTITSVTQKMKQVIDSAFNYLGKKMDEFVRWWMKSALKFQIALGFLLPKKDLEKAKQQLKALEMGIKDYKDIGLIGKFGLTAKQAVKISETDKKKKTRATVKEFRKPETIKRYYEGLNEEGKERFRETPVGKKYREMLKKSDASDKNMHTNIYNTNNNTYLLPEDANNENKLKVKMYNMTGGIPV